MKQPILISLAISLAVGVITFAAGSLMVRRALETRPPIAIIDYRPISNAVALGTPVKDIEPFLQATKARAKAYEEAGFVVINAASIDAAPDDVFVPPLDDLPESWTTALPPTPAQQSPAAGSLQGAPR